MSTPKRVGDGTTIHQQVLHPQVGKQPHGGNLHHGMSDIGFLTDARCFAYRQCRFPCKRRVVYTGHQTRTQCRVPSLSCQRLSHAQHVHQRLACARRACGSRRVTTRDLHMKRYVFTKTFCLHTQRSMAHSTLSLMIPPSSTKSVFRFICRSTLPQNLGYLVEQFHRVRKVQHGNFWRETLALVTTNLCQFLLRDTKPYYFVPVGVFDQHLVWNLALSVFVSWRKCDNVKV